MISKSEQFLEKIGIDNNQIISQLHQYHDLLFEYNKKVNLISRKDTENIWEHHIFPSLLGNTLCNIPERSTLLDFGTGAGLPGIILKIVRPDLQVNLVDSISKKMRFLDHVVEKIGLNHIQTFTHRLTARDPLPNLKKTIDVVTVRAVSRLENIYQDCHKMLIQGGFFLTWKGDSDLDDLQELKSRHHLSAEICRPDSTLYPFSKRIESLLLFKIAGK